jgi:hypothetical protein
MPLPKNLTVIAYAEVLAVLWDSPQDSLRQRREIPLGDPAAAGLLAALTDIVEV